MELNKSVSNPMLVGAMELLKAEDTPQHRNLFVEEMLKANLISPAVIIPAPECDGSGIQQLVTGSQVQFPMISTQDGKRFFMAFTDKMEMKKWKQDENITTVTLSFKDYAGMLLGKDKQGNTSPALGFVINPFGANMIISKEMVDALLSPSKQ
ncbi:MAG: SseB family protein [Lachnospiraceae bacterium]|nr:SseB family protein [Lachnospiraceae bacterium]